MKPNNYPLPWCEELDMPYWSVNMLWCIRYQDWKEYQSGKSIAQLMPEIDLKIKEYNG